MLFGGSISPLLVSMDSTYTPEFADVMKNAHSDTSNIVDETGSGGLGRITGFRDLLCERRVYKEEECRDL